MNLFKSISKYYATGRFDKSDVSTFVVAGWITPEQYTQITGDPYVAA